MSDKKIGPKPGMVDVQESDVLLDVVEEGDNAAVLRRTREQMLARGWSQEDVDTLWPVPK